MLVGKTHKKQQLPIATIGIGAFLSSLIYLLGVLGVPGAIIVIQFAPLPLLYVAFKEDLKATIIATTIALFGIIASGSIPIILNYLTSVAMGVVIVSFVLSQQIHKSKLGNILFVLTFLGALLLVIGSFSQDNLFPDPKSLETFWENFEKQSGMFIADEQKQLFMILLKYLPGIIASFWGVVFVALIFVAQQAYVRKTKQKPKISMAFLKLPNACFYLFLVALLGSFLSNESLQLLSVNLLFVLLVPFIFKSLSIVHTYFSRKSQRKIWLSLFYVFVFILGWPILILAVLGVIAHLRDLRIIRIKPQT